jgi:hypothetical protein
VAEPTQIDWARLAAFIDGEGCIRIASAKAKNWKREHLYIDVRIANTDPRLAQWLSSLFGGKIYTSPRKKSTWAACFWWAISCKKAAALLTECLPYLILKREQAETALALQSTMTNRWGVRGAPQEVIDLQQSLKVKLHDQKGRGISKDANWLNQSLQVN